MCKSSDEKSQTATLNAFCNWSGGGGEGGDYLITDPEITDHSGIRC